MTNKRNIYTMKLVQCLLLSYLHIFPTYCGIISDIFNFYLFYLERIKYFDIQWWRGEDVELFIINAEGEPTEKGTFLYQFPSC